MGIQIVFDNFLLELVKSDSVFIQSTRIWNNSALFEYRIFKIFHICFTVGYKNTLITTVKVTLGPILISSFVSLSKSRSCYKLEFYVLGKVKVSSIKEVFPARHLFHWNIINFKLKRKNLVRNWKFVFILKGLANLCFNYLRSQIWFDP